MAQSLFGGKKSISTERRSGKGETMKQSEAKLLSISLKSMEEKGKVAVKIARNIRMIDDELKEYYQYEAELFKKYGIEKDGQLVIDKNSENYQKFLNEMQPLDNEEVSFNFRRFTDEELENSCLNVNQVLLLMEYMGEQDVNINDTE